LGTLFSALSVARSGMAAAQIQLDTTAHNIANVNREGFSRQRVEMGTISPNIFPFGEIGRGVLVTDVTRIRDSFLDRSFRDQVSGLGSADVQAGNYILLEDAFLEPGENGFGTRIDQFFDSLNDFSNNVEDFPVREAFLQEAQAVADSLNQVAQRLYDLRTNANEEVRNLVPEINGLTTRISDLNQNIRDAELNGTSANDLRDERDVALDQLSRLVNITTRETSDGTVLVLLSNDVLVDQVGAREIEAVRNPALDPERDDLVELQFVDNGNLVDAQSGEVFGALEIRDNAIPGVDGRLDTIAAALIEGINAIHSQGNGLTNHTGTVSSTNLVSASTDPLIAAGLPFTVTPGTFDVVVYDASNVATTTSITIAAGTTLDDLATQLSGVANLSASVTGNQLDITPAAGFSFTFANDNTNALPALGLNGLFTGYDARTIDINQDLVNDPGLLASGYSTDVLDTGDNSAALDMAALREALVLDTGASTISQYYQSTIAELGVDARSNFDTLETEHLFVQDFDRRRKEVSGVSLDEEVTSLLLFQRAFEASARVITIADRMLETLLNVAR